MSGFPTAPPKNPCPLPRQPSHLRVLQIISRTLWRSELSSSSQEHDGRSNWRAVPCSRDRKGRSHSTCLQLDACETGKEQTFFLNRDDRDARGQPHHADGTGRNKPRSSDFGQVRSDRRERKESRLGEQNDRGSVVGPPQQVYRPVKRGDSNPLQLLDIYQSQTSECHA